MSRRMPLAFALAALLCASSLQAGEGDLEAGREAFARKDYRAAAEHLARAAGDLDPAGDREPLAEVYLQLGLSYLAGLDRPEEALDAFLRSAGLAANPASAYLWAAAAAEKLGRPAEAASFKERALAVPAAAAPGQPSAAPVAAAADPVPAPAPEPPPTVAAPAPAAAPEPTRKDKAFEHFFGGRKKETPAERPAPAPRASEAKPAAEPDAGEASKGAAFRHFFGRRKGSGEKPAGEAAPQEPPPDGAAEAPPSAATLRR